MRSANRSLYDVRCGAFSLLELLLVLAIIATLSAIAAPRYGMATIRYQADLAARRVVSDLELARSTARATGASQSVEFHPSQNDYVLGGVTALDSQVSEYVVDLGERPYGASLTTAKFAGDSIVIFDGWGLPDSGGTVTLSVGSEQRTVTVDAETGAASVQ